ncbi:uncharacterized protein BP5553_05973 [Venustampulla echinocandica]|uniref:Uncharacterized protein n=1 Tax=Venustampulla echinocandica TaxID=2656787 RepID=A0A370TM75_9HELO|nr:uncharacterized protein BP5553_05973 [Venustampulla echinocandica]RDL36621.1 hypothetical protein BP5553_05973 [Venustampulla echinocandica]
MAPSNDVSAQEHTSAVDSAADLSKAWTELLKGEKTAEALEKSLTPLEKKIDDLLASLEEPEQLADAGAASEQTNPEGGSSEDQGGKP